LFLDLLCSVAFLFSFLAKWDSSNAVDGVTSAKITHTNFEANAWWKVNLESSSDIERIRVWLRTDCCTERAKGFIVEVFNGDDVQFTFIQTGDLRATTLIKVVGLNGENIVGDNVKVSLPGTDYSSLVQVQVNSATPEP